MVIGILCRVKTVVDNNLLGVDEKVMSSCSGSGGIYLPIRSRSESHHIPERSVMPCWEGGEPADLQYVRRQCNGCDSDGACSRQIVSADREQKLFEPVPRIEGFQDFGKLFPYLYEEYGIALH